MLRDKDVKIPSISAVFVLFSTRNETKKNKIQKSQIHLSLLRITFENALLIAKNPLQAELESPGKKILSDIRSEIECEKRS